MQLTALLEKLVKDRELYDISDVSRAVFDNGVKSVLRGYTIIDGFVVVDYEYSEEEGPITPPQDFEYI